MLIISIGKKYDFKCNFYFGTCYIYQNVSVVHKISIQGKLIFILGPTLVGPATEYTARLDVEIDSAQQGLKK